MPTIRTKSGKTLDDVLTQADLFAPEVAAVTRRGDSIVPPTDRFSNAPNCRSREGMQLMANKLGDTIAKELAPLSHHADPHTSPQAARSMVQGAQHHRVAVMTALRLFGPATGHELAALLGLEYVQVAKRLTELAVDGRINRRETGTIGGKPAYQTRNSPTGRPACVWHINPLAKSA